MTQVNHELVKLLLSFSGIKGASFVGIRNYFIDSERKNSKAITSGYKNLLINVGVNRETLKNKNRNSLLELNKEVFYDSFVKNVNPNFTYELYLKAFNSVFDQCTIIGQKESNGIVKKEKSNRQLAHEITYTHVTTGLKFREETQELYISGVHHKSTSCENLPLPTYKSSNKHDKTKIQDILKAELNLKSFQYRTLILKNVDSLNASKVTFNGTELTIGM